ncbi:hypothetical protein [uncultured Nocardioides sp.]|uniref:hypothetical protein n=1 Tax=uncultured Nocardioides sp. TaxID=198441 RepID=UPI000C4E48F7|nr:hypothetical protein [uncultured Nocardioides sp.]MAO82057.1 hypothetical protein [Nocardioides sp.]
MILADIPIPDLELEAHDGLDVPHDMVALAEPLEPGQLLLVRTLDGVHRCAEVVGLDFTETTTIYRLTYGDPMAPEMAAALARPPRSALRHWVDDIDVEVLLGELVATARRTAETSQSVPESSW